MLKADRPTDFAVRLLGLGLLATLLINDSTTLFSIDGVSAAANCESWLSTASAPCIVPTWIARWLLAILLLPALFSPSSLVARCLLSYVAVSFGNSTFVADGGDHAAMNLSVLLALESALRRSVLSRRVLYLVGSFLVFFIYFQAFVAKFGVQEWADGTAVYYYIKIGAFSSPVPGIDGLIAAIAGTTIGVVVLSWGTIATEAFLAAGVFLRRDMPLAVFAVGFGLHLVFAVALGLFSFWLSMVAALTIYCWDWDRPLDEQVRCRLRLAMERFGLDGQRLSRALMS